MLPADHQFARVPPGGARPLEKEFGKGGEMLPADHQLNSLKKNGESSPWGGPPPGKKIGKGGDMLPADPIEYPL